MFFPKISSSNSKHFTIVLPKKSLLKHSVVHRLKRSSAPATSPPTATAISGDTAGVLEQDMREGELRQNIDDLNNKVHNEARYIVRQG